MTNVVRTTDGKWLLTFEYWGGGANIRYASPTTRCTFFRGSAGTSVTSLPVGAGSRPLAEGGSPVIVALPDGRLVYNAADSGNVWVNESGTQRRRVDGVPDHPRRPATAATSSTSPGPAASPSSPVPGRES